MGESDNKPFLTTLPGILTGVASLITALVALLGTLSKYTPTPRLSLVSESILTPQPQSAAAPAVMAQTLPAQPVKPQGCEKALGNWDWFLGGVVTFEKDGHLAWRARAADVLPTATGTWNCIDARSQEMTLWWQPTSMTDTVNLSADGRSIVGTNYTGIKITGTKR